MIALNSPLYLFYLNKWDSFSQFCSDFNNNTQKDKRLFEGYGFLECVYDNIYEKHYLFSLNGKIYSSMLINDNNESFKFIGIIELNTTILQNNFFRKYDPVNHFHSLEASVEVDCKNYDYGAEHKLLISQAGKVDLLFSQQLLVEDNKASIQTQTYPSLKQAVNWQMKVNEIEARTAKIMADKKNKH